MSTRPTLRVAKEPTLLERVESLERNGTPVVYVPVDGSTYVPGHGYRVAIVIAGEDGYRLTGSWPYTGAPGQKIPWFSGPTLEDALAEAERQNGRAGVSRSEAALVVLRAMARRVRASTGRRR